MLGLILFNLNRSKEAVFDFTEAIGIDPNLY